MHDSHVSRRHFLGSAAAVGLAGASWTAWADEPPSSLKPPPAGAGPTPAGGPGAAAPGTRSDSPATGGPAPDDPAAPVETIAPPPPPPEPTTATLPVAGGPKDRPLTKGFPQKGTMVLQSARPPVLETPFEVFNKGEITPVDRFFVSWRTAGIPSTVDPATFRLTVRGNVKQTLSLSLDEILSFARVEITAVAQEPGNSRGMFQPRVPGVQWGHGAMGNAKWIGVRLKDILDRAGVKPGTVQARFNGLDQPVLAGGPDYMKSLALPVAMNGEVIVAFAMNGEPLPLLNGFPLRLVVPGWYASYWVQMLNDIELLTVPDDNYWTVSADLVPNTPRADVPPEATGYGMVPVTRMVPRSFITNVKDGERLPPGLPAIVRGIAFGGDTGVARVEFSSDGGKSWSAAKLEKDLGKYSFRRWQSHFKPGAGKAVLMCRCTNTNGVTQSNIANWNPGGLMRNAIEAIQITVGEDVAPEQ